MGTKYIFFGFLFLLNPELITLDIFPDFIGYFLIAKGLYRTSLLEERCSKARKYSFYLAITSLLKLLACTRTFATRVESTRLTVCFLFLVAELSFSLLLCDNAFKGLQYLAIRKDGNLVLKSYDLVKTFTVVFFVTKAVVNFLPQAPVIFFTNIDADPDQVENFDQMASSFRSLRSILFVAGAIILVILGVYTARLLKAYLSRCKEDKIFAEKVLSDYRENVVENVSLQTRLAIRDAFFWFFLGFILLGDLYLDHINMFPKFFSPLFLYFGLKKLSKVLPVNKWWKSFSIVSFFVATAAYAFRLVSLVTNDDFPYTFPYQAPSVIVSVLGSVFLFIPLILTLLSIRSVSEKYTSFLYKKYFVLMTVFSVVLVSLGFSQYLFVGRSDLVVWLEWIFYAVTLYVHKSSLDDIYREAEYKLM